MIIEWEYRERLKKRICREFFLEIIESFLRDYTEFLRDYREYFEKIKRDYKERVQNFQGLSWFWVNYKELLLIESFWEIIEFFERL